MSKKTFMATIIMVAFLVSLVAGMQAVKVAKANPIPPGLNGIIVFLSPQNGTISPLPVFVNFTSESNLKWSNSQLDNFMFYVLDGQSMSKEGIKFTDVQYSEQDQYGNHNIKSGQAYLYGLNNGFHNITVYYGTTMGGSDTPPNEVIYYTPAFSAVSQFYVNSTMTTSPFPSTSPTPSPTPSPTLTVSSIITPSLAPTQQPTLEPSQTPDRPKVGDFAPVLIPATMILLGIIAVGLLVYFRRRRG